MVNSFRNHSEKLKKRHIPLCMQDEKIQECYKKYSHLIEAMKEELISEINKSIEELLETVEFMDTCRRSNKSKEWCLNTLYTALTAEIDHLRAVVIPVTVTTAIRKFENELLLISNC